MSTDVYSQDEHIRGSNSERNRWRTWLTFGQASKAELPNAESPSPSQTTDAPAHATDPSGERGLPEIVAAKVAAGHEYAVPGGGGRGVGSVVKQLRLLERGRGGGGGITGPPLRDQGAARRGRLAESSSDGGLGAESHSDATCCVRAEGGPESGPADLNRRPALKARATRARGEGLRTWQATRKAALGMLEKGFRRRGRFS